MSVCSLTRPRFRTNNAQTSGLHQAQMSGAAAGGILQEEEGNGNNGAVSAVDPGMEGTINDGSAAAQDIHQFPGEAAAASKANNALGMYNWQSTKMTVKERLAFMFNNDILADVYFIVGKDSQQQRVPAHKFVLSIGKVTKNVQRK